MSSKRKQIKTGRGTIVPPKWFKKQREMAVVNANSRQLFKSIQRTLPRNDRRWDFVQSLLLKGSASRSLSSGLTHREIGNLYSTVLNNMQVHSLRQLSTYLKIMNDFSKKVGHALDANIQYKEGTKSIDFFQLPNGRWVNYGDGNVWQSPNTRQRIQNRSISFNTLLRRIRSKATAVKVELAHPVSQRYGLNVKRKLRGFRG